MRLRNALRVLIDNFSNSYKLLLYRLVMGIIFLALSYAVLNFGLGLIFGSEEFRSIFVLIGEFFEAVVSGKTAYLETFQESFLEALKNFLGLLGEHLGSIVSSVIGVCALYLVSKFLNGIANFAMGSIIGDKMDSYSKTGFAYAYFKNLGRAMLYEVIYVPLSFVYDLVSVAFCWFFFFYMPSLFSSWGILTVLTALSVAFAVYLCLQALKMTIVSAWMPAAVIGNGVIGGLKSACKGFLKGFGGRFSNYLIALYLIVILNIVCGICTLCSFLLITVPASYLFLLALQFVCFYEDNGKRYYVSLHTIAGEKETQVSAE